MTKFWRMVLLFGRGMEEPEKAAAIAKLISDLQAHFKAEGYTYDKSWQGFVKKDGDLSFLFSLNLFVHPDAFTIRPRGAIRHDTIEGIFHRVSGAPDTVKKLSGTVLWNRALERRVPKPDSFTVDRVSQLSAAVSFTKGFFTNWIEPFFRANTSLNAISDGFNQNANILNAKIVTDWFEMLGRATIAAKLAKRDDYETLKRKFREVLRTAKSAHPNARSAFDSLVEILDATATVSDT
jgi:hypothetical protein